MIDALKEITFDFQEFDLPTGVLKLVDAAPVPEKATIFIGVRRGGKSTFMFQFIQLLQDAGVLRKKILHLNFSDDHPHNFHHGGLSVILEADFSLYPEKKHTEKVHCFFDEIQVVTDWEPSVDRLTRTEKCEVYITASSAQMLSREVATQMRGRALSWERIPLSSYSSYDTLPP